MSKDEVKLCLMNFGQVLCDKDIEIIVEKYDGDSDGFLEFQEFVDLLSYIEHE